MIGDGYFTYADDLVNENDVIANIPRNCGGGHLVCSGVNVCGEAF